MPVDRLTLARNEYAGVVMASIGFGSYLVISIQSIAFLLRKRNDRVKTIMLPYSLIMFGIVCTYFGIAAVSNEHDLVEALLHPTESGRCIPIDITREVLITLIFWSGDGLLLWRVWTIWQGNLLAMLLPALAYLGTIAAGFGLNLTCLSSELGGPVKDSAILNFGLPFLGLSASMNVLATGLIVYKLLIQRQHMRAVGFAQPEVDEYTTVTGILMESAVFYALAAIIYIPIRVLNLPVGIPIGAIQGTAAMICPALIQLRIAQGIMYGRRTQTQVMSRSLGGPIQFAQSDATRTMGTTNTIDKWSENNMEMSKVGI